MKTPILFVLSAIVIFISYFFYFSKTFVRNCNGIDHVINEEFNKSLNQSFIHNGRNIHAITGPYRSGKTSNIDILCEDLIFKREIPILVRLSSIVSLEEIFDDIRLSYVKNMYRLFPFLTLSQQSQLKVISGNFSSSKFVLSIPKKYFSDEMSILGKIKGVNAFLSIIHSIVPCHLVVDDADLLFLIRDKNGAYINNESIMFLEELIHKRPYQVVLTLSNTLYLQNVSYLNNLIIHDLNYSENFVEELIKRHYFTRKETNSILKIFGIHPGVMSSIYKHLVTNQTLKDSITFVNANIKESIAITGNNKLMKQICISKGRLYLKDIYKESSALKMIKSGFLWINREGMVETAHNGIVNIACSLS